jgi:hypothetical protein
MPAAKGSARTLLGPTIDVVFRLSKILIVEK